MRYQLTSLMKNLGVNMNKVALITGASGKIGLACARKFKEENYKLALAYRSEEKLINLCEFKDDKDVIFLRGDLRNSSDCKNIVEKTIERFGQIHVLINNAGVTRDKLVLTMKDEDFSYVIESNLYSAFYMCKYVLKNMIKNKYGKIINISSVVALRGNIGQANYAASKAGLLGLTKSLSAEVASRNINVNAICPGFIKSQMTQGLEDKYVDKISAKRLGEAKDVASLAYFLASEDCSYIHGQEIVVDGGLL